MFKRKKQQQSTPKVENPLSIPNFKQPYQGKGDRGMGYLAWLFFRKGSKK